MNIYAAGVSGGPNQTEIKYLRNFYKYRLYSYVVLAMPEFGQLRNLLNKIKKFLHMNRTAKNPVKLFLDSGAFSAWSKGAEIKIEEYIQFIKDNKEYIDMYSNLDVIGSAEGTWKNQKIMEKAGLSPIPVYHYGEDIKWLKKLLTLEYPYISLGGMVPISTKDLIHWLDELWSTYLTDDKGMPIVKVHGFGLTSLPLMLRYPWYSVDSTSWVVTGRMGAIYVPKMKNGEYIYDENSWKISVSNKSPDQKEAGQHLLTMAPAVRKLILEYIHGKGYVLGKSEFKKETQSYELKENEKWNEKKPKDKSALREVEILVERGISNDYKLRDEMNIQYFLDLEQSIQKWPWPFVKKATTKSFF